MNQFQEKSSTTGSKFIEAPVVKNLNTMEGKMDHELWQEFKEGNEQAFLFIYNKYFDSLFHYGFQFAQSKEQLEDCIQDLFVYLRIKKSNLGNVKSIKFYLFFSLKRRILKAKEKRSIFTKYLPNNHQNFPITVSPEFSLIKNQVLEEQKELIEKAMNKLSARQREAIILFYYHGMSYKEIALIMKLKKVKYARTLIYRTLEKLAKYLSFLKPSDLASS